MTESEKNKVAIAEAMKRLMRETPIEKITTDRILENAGVSRRSFYRYFKDKYDLLEWIYNYDFCRFVDVRPEKSIWDYYPDILRSLRADPEFYGNAFVYAGQNSFRAFCFEKLFPLIMTDFGDLPRRRDCAVRDPAVRLHVLRRVYLVAQKEGAHERRGIRDAEQKHHPGDRRRHPAIV